MNHKIRNKVETLMRQAAVHVKETQTESLVKGLGIRIDKILPVNEKGLRGANTKRIA